ncbi:high affinity immunoglobulin gamma Fc receptor I-like [Aquarana catesbeiana]|uniref:high affinity immunoglobulin gamma Fc receptor I-like n=1 Tax=Aquarana catesbeiana TaxID=8400 RepID=UPI003CC93D53
MSVFLAIVLLSLNVGKSGGAIKPVVTFTPNWGNIIYYDDVTLTCDVPSTVPEEPRTYHWYKDKRPIPGDQQRLHITSSVEEDRGDYQCQTIGGDISDPVFLDVTHKLVILQRPPSAIYEGDPLTLRCHHIRDFNAINTKFYKDDQEIKSSKSDSTFHIPNIMMSQSGLYKCTKQIQLNDSPYVHEHSDVSFISVKELFSPPELKVTPSRVIEGDKMTVRCDTRLDPLRGGTELHFAFYRDGRTVPGYNISKTYRVRSSQLEDSGKYTCEVRTRSDTVRKMSDGLYIQIYELFSPPEIKVTPSRVIEGDKMTVRCDTRLDPLRGGTELHFAFYRDGRTVRGYDVSDTYRVQSSQLEDSGNYTCEVRTVSDTVRKMNDEIYIQIYELFSPPEIKVTPSRVIEGDEMTVRCDTRRDPLRGGTELHFAFYRDGRTVRGYNVSDTYRVRSSQQEDSGKYTCEVRMRSDTVRKMSDGLYIQIHGYVILQRPPSAIYEGDPLTLRCHHVEHFNAINTKFYNDDQEIKSSKSD